LIGTLFKKNINNEWFEPHGFELSFPQWIFILVIGQDKITFGENTRAERPIILIL
jgi:hypothetical protein